MANKTVDSDAAFKTYVEGLPAYASGTVYMNDDSKYWTFNKQATDKINSMCVNGDDIEVWVYDGTDWITNKIPVVVDNLTTDSAIAALSAKQGKLLNDKITSDWSIVTNFFTAASGYATYGDAHAFKYGRLVWIRLSVTKSDQSAFSQTRHTVGTLSSKFRPRTNTSLAIPASNNINSFLTRITNAIITTSGDIIIDCFQNNDVKQISITTFFISENP